MLTFNFAFCHSDFLFDYLAILMADLVAPPRPLLAWSGWLQLCCFFTITVEAFGKTHLDIIFFCQRWIEKKFISWNDREFGLLPPFGQLNCPLKLKDMPIGISRYKNVPSLDAIFYPLMQQDRKDPIFSRSLKGTKGSDPSSDFLLRKYLMRLPRSVCGSAVQLAARDIIFRGPRVY